MNKNFEENEEESEEKNKNLNSFNMNIFKGIPEKKRHNLFSFAGFIDEKTKEKIALRIKKLSLSKKSKASNAFIVNIEQIEQITKNLLTLEPFFPEFNKLMDKNGDNIIAEISYASKEDFFEKNKIIYKYGDEVDRFYIIYEGEVELYFPFTEEVEMNIDEFYIYILRLRRYDEFEMLNDVLLLNEEKFLKEINGKFDVDRYIYKLYISYIRLKFDPEYLFKEENKDKNDKSSNIYKNIINFDDTFDDKEIKELILRISDELIDTIKYIMPKKMYEIIEEKVDGKFKKKIIKMPEQIIKIYKKLNPLNIINGKNYNERILPKKVLNDNLPSKKMIIMKYLKADTLNKGQTFGDFNSDSFTLFSHYYLEKMKNSNLKLLKVHQHHNFRNMTVITSSHTFLYSFGKTVFCDYFSKYIERKTYKKKVYILNHPLFSNSNNKNLLKTYSICFNEKLLKEEEDIIKENDTLTESNIFTYFIIRGECQLSCIKTIPQIDEIIKILGKEDEIKNTYNKNVKEILNTPQYEDLVKDPVKFKLNYLSKYDIIGLTEYFNKDKYFLNVKCTQKGTKIYKVDSRIIKLLIDSDEMIKENKNKIIYEKYNRLSENLINQRKMFFDSLLNEKKISLDIDNIDTGYRPNKKKYKPLPQINTYKIPLSNFLYKFDNLNPKTVKNNIYNKTKLSHFSEDLDKLLIGITHRFTLRDRRINKTIEFRKKLKEKMEKTKQRKELEIKLNKVFEEKETNKMDEKKVVFDKKFGAFRKTNSLFRNIFRVLPLLKTNTLKNSESQYELVLPYEYHKLKNSNSTSEINPLFYDDFNRSFNLSQYFNLKNDRKDKSEEKKKGSLEYEIKLSGITDNNKKIYNKMNFQNNGFKTLYKRINIRRYKSNPP